MRMITRILQLATLLSALAFITSVLFQIYARFFMTSAPSWTEEASRFFFIYAMSFSAGLAVKDNEYVFLDFFYTRMSFNFQRVIDIMVPILVTGLFVIVGIQAFSFVQLGINEKSPSIPMPMAWAFASILIMPLSIAFYSVRDISMQIGGKK